VATQPLEDLAARLERERLDADRRYNDALTALDRALPPANTLPGISASVDGARLPELNRSWDILPGGAPPSHRSWRGRLRGFVWRLVGPPLDAQKQFNALLVEHLNRNADTSRELRGAAAAIVAALSSELDALRRFESLLVQYLQTITPYVDSKDRAALGGDLRERIAMAEQRILGLKREVEKRAVFAPEPEGRASERPRATEPIFAGPADSVTYVGFEDRFRGSQHEIRARIEAYLPLFDGSADVVDIGCGRGELLRALRERGVTARGVDANAGMVELCRADGLDVEHGDALSFLQRQRDASLGGVAAIQVVEHLEPAYLVRMLEATYHKLRPGAPLLLETINPACWLAFFETYIRDPTHVRPLHPDTLRFLVESSGFTAVDVQFRQPVAESDRLPRVRILGDTGEVLPRNLAQLADAVNAHADRLNARLFSYADYAVIARR
jgi:O-antigen chain-terminating methyltransferase